MGGSLSDFWWLTQNQLDRFTYLELGHSEPVDDSTRPVIQAQKYHINTIDAFRNKYHNTNIYRSLKLSDGLSANEEIIGPLIIDIDNENSLGASLVVTRQVLTYLLKQLRLSPTCDLRIFFTGHKGFNIEIRSDALGLTEKISEHIKHSSQILDIIIRDMRRINNVNDICRNSVDNNNTVVDRIYGDKYNYQLKHPFIRLHDSINKWVKSSSELISRKKIEIKPHDLTDMSITDITSKSK